MNDATIEQLKREMEEVIALPEGDTKRQQVLDRIAQAGAEAEAYWLSLVNEDEQIRLALKRVDTPQGLADRLNTIPDHADTPAPKTFKLQRYASLAAMIIIGVLIFIVSQPQTVQATESLAMMAITHHNNQTDKLDITSDDPRQVEKTLARGVHFPVGMPKMDPAYKLIGGSLCLLGEHHVIYTRWEKDNKRYTLYQFCKPMYNIDADMPDHEVLPKTANRFKVVFWSKDSLCAYALVEEIK